MRISEFEKLIWPPTSSVNRGLSRRGQGLAEEGTLVTVGEPLANTQKKVQK